MPDWKFYRDRYVIVNGVRTRYWEAGKGRKTVLFLHGFSGAAEEWIYNIPAFETRFRVLAVDVPGQGMTGKPQASYTHDYYSEFLLGFMDSMKVKTAHLVGHSMGGMIALHYALKYPAKAGKLVLISPACGRKYGFFMHLATVPGLGELFLKPPATQANVREAYRALTFKPFSLPDKVIKRAFDVYRSAGYQAANLRYLRNSLGLFGLNRQGKTFFRSLAAGLPGMDKPVLLFWGKEDRVVPVKAADFLENTLRNLDTCFLPECGHNPHWEYCGQFNTMVRKFLLT
jgi:pimeloyl-ACP methyl ester carboxylesterase